MFEADNLEGDPAEIAKETWSLPNTYLLYTAGIKRSIKIKKISIKIKRRIYIKIRRNIKINHLLYTVCQRALCKQQFETPDGKILSVEMVKELIYNFVEDGSITVKTNNTYCEGIRLKIHSNVADASLVPSQILIKITKRSLFPTNQAQFLQRMLEYWYQRSVP